MYTLSKEVVESLERVDASADRKYLTACFLERLHAHTPFYHEHSARLGEHAEHITRGMDPLVRVIATVGAFLHDVGKIEVRAELLTDTRKTITPEEYREIQVHPFAGFNLLYPHDRLVAAVAGLHHRKGENGYGLDYAGATEGLDPVDCDATLLASRIDGFVDYHDAFNKRSALDIHDLIPKLMKDYGLSFDDAMIRVNALTQSYPFSQQGFKNGISNSIARTIQW
jgi:hypothetical protein